MGSPEGQLSYLIRRRCPLPRLSLWHDFDHDSGKLSFYGSSLSYCLSLSLSSISHLVVNVFIIKILWLQAPDTYSGLLGRKKKIIRKALTAHRVKEKAGNPDGEGSSLNLEGEVAGTNL